MKQLINIIFVFSVISNYGQTQRSKNAIFKLKEVVMIDLEPDNSSLNLKILEPNEAGEKATVVMANNKKWINFSSAVIDGNSRSISIQIEAGQVVPPGIYLKLSTSNYAGIGKGELGSPAGVVTLSNVPQTIISNIKGAYTGNGINNGYELTYNLEIYDYKLLDFDQSTTLSITLTLTDF